MGRFREPEDSHWVTGDFIRFSDSLHRDESAPMVNHALLLRRLIPRIPRQNWRANRRRAQHIATELRCAFIAAFEGGAHDALRVRHHQGPDLKGFGAKGRVFFWLREGIVEGRAVHVGFVANNKAEVDAAYSAAARGGSRGAMANSLQHLKRRPVISILVKVRFSVCRCLSVIW